MKRIIICLFCLLLGFYGFGQVSWNAKAGMNFSRVTGWINSDLKPGYQFGVGMDYYFNDHWGILPSLMLISKGHKAKGENIDLTGEPLAKFNMTENRIYLELPVMLAYRFSISNDIRLVVNGGGYISYGIHGKVKNRTTVFEDGSKHKDNYDAFSDRAEKFDTGLCAGTTFEFKNRYTLGLIGEWGLKSSIGNTYKNQTYGLNLGYKF